MLTAQLDKRSGLKPDKDNTAFADDLCNGKDTNKKYARHEPD